MSNGTNRGNPNDVAVQMRITLNRAGQIRVDGPIHDKILCFGLMEAAKCAINEAGAKRLAEPAIEVASEEVQGVLLGAGRDVH